MDKIAFAMLMARPSGSVLNFRAHSYFELTLNSSGLCFAILTPALLAY
jgi:hypothetical protein